ncbi:gliding motility lipoprotein GldH [Spongiimicrobium sp. 2-473A-2-J]|uniref:gliding motility lipoprotein GldH n=1 Tax=Eudoraea algarum TaxID=3417568 RepID=UPI003D35B001
MHKFIAISILFILLLSCNERTVHSEYQATKGNSWSKNDTIKFSFSELDTVIPYDMFINIRNDNTFPYSNLFLITELTYPNGESVRDTLEYEMAMPDGQWLGKGYGSIKENKLWYRENIVFPDTGVYTLLLSHAMRKNGSVDGVVDLSGIVDVGFEIEKSK